MASDDHNDEVIEVAVEAAVERSNKVEDPGEITRFTGEVSAFWSGVKGCCDPPTPQQQIDASWRRWMEEQKRAHQDLAFWSSGHEGGRASCQLRGGSMGVPRNCDGRATVNAWIEFYEPF